MTTPSRGCPITLIHKHMGRYGPRAKCNEPLAPGAKFCAKHEADRIRLSR